MRIDFVNSITVTVVFDEAVVNPTVRLDDFLGRCSATLTNRCTLSGAVSTSFGQKKRR